MASTVPAARPALCPAPSHQSPGGIDQLVHQGVDGRDVPGTKVGFLLLPEPRIAHAPVSRLTTFTLI
jgi:hypothetical protein